MPTDEPRRAGFTISRRSPTRSEKTSSSSSTPFRSWAQRAAVISSHSTTGSPDAADEALEEGLVHADRGSRHARARVGEVVGLEQGLDRAVLAEWAVQSRKDDRPWIARRPRSSSSAAGVRGPAAPLEAGSSNTPGTRPSGDAHRPASDHQPPRRSMKMRSTESPAPASASAIAQPEMTETSCSADGPPSSTTAWRFSPPVSVARFGCVCSIDSPVMPPPALAPANPR